MILDKQLIFAKKEDVAWATSRAICLGQNDLNKWENETDGMGPYSDLFLQVSSDVAHSAVTLTIEHSDTETGTYTTLAQYPAVSAVKGQVLLKAPFPFPSKNWVRIKQDAARQLDAFLVYGVDKRVITND